MEKLIFLFLTFLEIGAVSFGGGYGMISLIREKVLQYGWLSESDFLNFIRRPPLCGGNDSRHCTDDGRQYTAWFFFSFRKNQPGCARHRIVCLPSASARAIRKNMEEKALADSDDTDFGGAGDTDVLERI